MNDISDKPIFVEPIRQSVWVLVFKLFSILFFTDMFYLIIRIVFFDLRIDWLPHRDMTVFFLLFLSTLYSIEIPTILTVVLKWINTLYYISEGKITIRKGMFRIEGQSYNLKDIKKISVSQGLIGKLCNFGTVSLIFAAPSIKENVILYLVPKPKELEQQLKIFL